MKLSTLIVDDEPIALKKLRNYVEKFPELELVGECQSAIEAQSILRERAVDLLITDINMPDFSGMEFVKSLTAVPMIVFTTAYPQYAVESYRVDAIDYLLKPYQFTDFLRAINKCFDAYATKHQSPSVAIEKNESVFVKIDHRYIRLSSDEITYIKGFGEYLQVYREGNASPLVTLSSFAAIKERLSGNFLQVHRSWVVNMNKVAQIHRSRVLMTNGTEIPIGDSFKLQLQEYLRIYGIGKTAINKDNTSINK